MNDDIDDGECEQIIRECAHGRSQREIATLHNLPIRKVREIIAAAAAEAFTPEQLRVQWMLEANRLRTLGLRYYARAMSNAPDAAACGALYVKISERLSVISGFAAPQTSIQLIHATVAHVENNSAQKLRKAIDGLLGRPDEPVDSDETKH